jgi:hypothetical protein
MDPEERAREGVFLAFQYPVEIPGVNSTYFLKGGAERGAQAQRPARVGRDGVSDAGEGEDEAAGAEGRSAARPVNEGFSGGEKKRNEIFQMAVLEPRWRCWTKPIPAGHRRAEDRGGGVNKLRRPDNAQLVITHYQRLLNYIVPGLRARAVRRPHPPDRRQGTGAGVGGKRLRLADAPGRCHSVRQRRHSHSMVPGGLLVISKHTRLTPFTSLMMRLESRSIRSYGSFTQSAVMPSCDSTARMAMVYS